MKEQLVNMETSTATLALLANTIIAEATENVLQGSQRR